MCAHSPTHSEHTDGAGAHEHDLLAELMAEVDELAGPRGRSRYVAEAVAQRVKRDKLGKAIRDTAGIMVGKPG